MAGYKRYHFANNYAGLINIFWKTLLLFGVSGFCIVSVLQGNASNIYSGISTRDNGKVGALEKWKAFSGARKVPRTDYQSSSDKTGSDFWRFIQPSFKCPEHLLTKVGEIGDAGRWMCGLNTIGRSSGPCSAFTSGSKDNVFFEVEIMALTKCRVYSYEPSGSSVVDHPLKYFDDRVTVSNKKNLGVVGTLKMAMQNNVGFGWVDVVKLDLGKEEDVKTLEGILKEFGNTNMLPIGQLLVRLRVDNWNKGKDSGSRILKVLEKLETKSMRLFYKQQSPYEQDKVADFSFLNIGALETFLDWKGLNEYKNEQLK